MRALLIDQNDNVAVIVEDTKRGGVVTAGAEPIIANEDIKTGHKIARKDIKKGEMVIKYNAIIGKAGKDIKKGDWVHCHNVEDITEQLSEAYVKEYRARGGKK